MNQENKNLAFDTNIKQEVELSFNQPKEILSKFKNEDGSDKYSYLYGIKRTINGENAFFATSYLNSLIQDTGAKEGTKISITKTEKTVDGDKRLGWDVQVTGGETKEVDVNSLVNNLANKMDVNKANINDTNEVKELSLEEKVNILWAKHDKKEPNKNLADDLPF